MELKTKRLLLRQWELDDFEEFAKINADPDVMEYYPQTLSAKDSDALANKFMALIEKRGWGFWAVERLDDNVFIGFVGLNEPNYELPVSPCVEIGWRLAKEQWGFGYATEAAKEVLKFAFQTLKLEQVYSFTSVINKKSEAVMKRLNMDKSSVTFNHVLMADNKHLQEHYLYKINKQDWHRLLRKA